MATPDAADAGRIKGQPARPQTPAGNDIKPTTGRGGETLPQATAAYLGPKMGLPHEFGRYRVQKQLGGGGMGAVFLVVNTELQREEALKVPHFDAADDPEVHERFLREARAAAGLDHPNLCPVYDVGVLDGIYYLTMRHLKGKLLSDHTGTPQPPRKSVEIVAKLAQALSAAHAKGVIHRDLKPNNVMMCAGVGPVVMDFGLAKQKQGEDQKLTQAGTTLGTPAYMPPEQVTGDLERIGPASDVYSLGVILFELLTGTLPFRGKTAGEVYGKICHTEAPTPSSLRPGLNPTLDAICRKAMAKTPEGRYPSMKAFAAALIEFLKATPPGEGAGALTVTKAGPADVFQAPTVAPGHAAASTPNPRTVRATDPAPKGGRAPSGVRKPVQTQRARAAADDERGGRSVGGVLGLFALVLLMIGALGGIGYLVYLVSQNKGAPSANAVAIVTPASASANDRPPEIAKADGPKADGPKDNSPKTDPIKVDLPGFNPPPVFDPAPKSDPPKIDKPPKNDPPKFDPAPKVDPSKADPPKPPAHVDPKPDDPDPGLLLSEDFKEVDVGGRPKGWDGDAFGVQTEDGLPCLEVTNETPEVYYITLPKLFVKGDFALETEFRLGGGVRNAVFESRFSHFMLELRSRSSTPLPITVDDVGTVKLDAAQKEAKGYRPQTNIRLRLARKGDIYNVSINGEIVVGKTIPDKGAFEELRIGLTGGKNTIRSRVYSVRITSLEKDVPKAVGAGPLPGLREDFNKAAAGSLPDGWTASKAANMAVQKTGDNADLELVNPALGNDIVMLPKVDLKGDFYADLAAVLPERESAVEIFFKGGAKTRPLAVELAHGGAVTVAGLPKSDGSKAWAAAGPNVLRVERAGKEKGYVVKLNDIPVGTVPLTLAPGPFNEVDLAVIVVREGERPGGGPGGGFGPIIATAKKTPQITSVQVIPLEDAPAP